MFSTKMPPKGVPFGVRAELVALLETAMYQEARVVLVLFDDMARQNRLTAALITTKVAADDCGIVLFLHHGVAEAVITDGAITTQLRCCGGPVRAYKRERTSLAKANRNTMAIRITRGNSSRSTERTGSCCVCSLHFQQCISAFSGVYLLMDLQSATPKEVADLLRNNGIDHLTVDCFLGELAHARVIMRVSITYN